MREVTVIGLGTLEPDIVATVARSGMLRDIAPTALERKSGVVAKAHATLDQPGIEISSGGEGTESFHTILHDAAKV
jgi:hypothetical protein